jgi:hypothetical protein
MPEGAVARAKDRSARLARRAEQRARREAKRGGRRRNAEERAEYSAAIADRWETLWVADVLVDGLNPLKYRGRNKQIRLTVYRDTKPGKLKDALAVDVRWCRPSEREPSRVLLSRGIRIPVEMAGLVAQGILAALDSQGL